MKQPILVVLAILFSFFTIHAQTFQWVKGGGGSQSGNTLSHDEQVRFICTDSNRNVYVASTVFTQSLAADTFYDSYGHYPNNQQILLSSYRCDGTMRWSRLFEGYTEMSVGGLVYDGAGGIYMSGNDGGWGYPLYLGDGVGTTAYDNKTAFLVKYDTSGNKQWVQFIGATPSASVNTASSNGLAMDGQGNMHNFVSVRTGYYIAPGVTSTKGIYDVKYAATGTLISATRLNIDSNYFMVFGAVISKKSNKIFATIVQDPAFGGTRYLAAFNPAGTLLWSDSTVYANYSYIFNPIYDGNNGVFVSGTGNGGVFKFGGQTVNNSSYTQGDMGTVIKTDTNGAIGWIYKIDSKYGNGALNSVALLSSNTLIAGGNFAGTVKHGNDSLTTLTNVGAPYYTILDTGGHHFSMAKLNVANGFYDAINAIAVDKSGSACMGGFIASGITVNNQTYTSHGGQTDFFVTKYGYACNCTPPASSFISTISAVKTVQFTYTGTSAGIDSVVWNFGDGQKQKVTSNYAAPLSHTYATNGHYTATVTTYNSCGANTFSKAYALSIGSLNTLNNVKAYPNPANDYLTIEGAAGATATLMNSIGQQVMMVAVTNSKRSIDLRGIASGIYILVVQDKDGNKGTMRITKQ